MGYESRLLALKLANQLPEIRLRHIDEGQRGIDDKLPLLAVPANFNRARRILSIAKTVSGTSHRQRPGCVILCFHGASLMVAVEAGGIIASELHEGRLVLVLPVDIERDNQSAHFLILVKLPEQAFIPLKSLECALVCDRVGSEAEEATRKSGGVLIFQLLNQEYFKLRHTILSVEGRQGQVHANRRLVARHVISNYFDFGICFGLRIEVSFFERDLSSRLPAFCLEHVINHASLADILRLADRAEDANGHFCGRWNQIQYLASIEGWTCVNLVTLLLQLHVEELVSVLRACQGHEAQREK